MRLGKLLATLVAGAVLTGCANSAVDGHRADAPVVVYAAASLQDAFDTLIEEYVAEHPDAEFAALETAGSQQLVQQLNQGAHADVLALANEQSLEPLQAPASEADFAIFAENTLVIVVPAGNPAGISSLADLANPEHAVVICEATVPCGNATAQLLDQEEIRIDAVSEEHNVRAVLTKVELGDADAGLVYRSDAMSSESVEVVDAAGADRIVNRYPIGALSDHPHADGFVEFVRGDRGREVLTEAGLAVPDLEPGE